jgi:hypothetical protein
MPFPALTRVGPARDPEQAFDVALDVFRQTQFEQIRLAAFFERAHDGVRAEAAIAAHHLRFALGGQLIKHRQQAGQRVATRVLVAGLDLDAHHQAQPGHQVGVVTVRRTTWFVRVVRHHRAFLLAVQRLDRGVDVKNPRRIEQRRRTLAQVRIEPGYPFGFANRHQRPAQRILTDHLVHSQQTGIDPVTTNRRHMRVAPMTRQDRQHPGTQHVGLARRVWAGVGQRAAFLPARPQPGQRQKLDEVGQLPHRRGGAVRLPAHLHTPARRVHSSARHLHLFGLKPLQFRLTHQVTPSINVKPIACQHFRNFARRQLRFLG